MKRFAIPIEEIELSSVSLTDTRFKISKPGKSDTIEKSLLQHGQLEPALLLFNNESNSYSILVGHNRINALAASDFSTVHARVLDIFRADIFFEYGLLKLIHDDIGPIGKVRLYRIITLETPTTSPLHIECKKALHLPADIADNDTIIETILEFPEHLLHYLDSRDISFKIITEIATAHEDLQTLFSLWIQKIPLRVNILKHVVSLCLDIFRRDRRTDHLYAIEIDELMDNRAQEHYLVETLRAIRYPEYTSQKLTANNLISEIEKKGIHVTFPEYFEGDTINLRYDISKKGGSTALERKIEGTPFMKVQELLDLL